jgi:hypothetical protein
MTTYIGESQLLKIEKGSSVSGKRASRLIALLGAASTLLAGAVMAAPRLVMPEQDFNFGFVPQNSQIAHVFWLHSKGDDTLKIISVKPG